jgi:uncharacterized membrane protein (TIGR02234 family)
MAESPGRKTFAPVVLLGLASGTLAAVASNQTWVTSDGTSSGSFRDYTPALTTGADGKMPLALALSLVVLAAWGVLLVTRGVVRRALGVLAVVASLGVVATVIAGHQTLPGNIRNDFRDAGLTDAVIHSTGWFWAAAAGAVLSVVAACLAVRHVRDWPEMGSRYDAPGAAPVEDPESSLEMWKAIDEGRDPTT